MSEESPAHCDKCGQAKYLSRLVPQLEAQIEQLTKDLEELNMNCISLSLHESRMTSVEKERDEWKDRWNAMADDAEEFRVNLAIAIQALELIQHKSPRCDCMDAPGIAIEALKKIKET